MVISVSIAKDMYSETLVFYYIYAYYSVGPVLFLPTLPRLCYGTVAHDQVAVPFEYSSWFHIVGKMLSLLDHSHSASLLDDINAWREFSNPAFSAFLLCHTLPSLALGIKGYSSRQFLTQTFSNPTPPLGRLQ